MSHIVIGYQVDAAGRRWPIRQDEGESRARAHGLNGGSSGISGSLVVGLSGAESDRIAERAYKARKAAAGGR